MDPRLSTAAAPAPLAPESLGVALDRGGIGIAVLRGPELRHEQVNQAYQAVAPGCAILGRTADQVWPELRHRAAELRQAMARGEPQHLAEAEPGRLGSAPSSPGRRFFDVRLVPLAAGAAEPPGLLALAVDCTGVVLARRRAELLAAVATELAGVEGPALDFRGIVERVAAVLGAAHAAALALDATGRTLRAAAAPGAGGGPAAHAVEDLPAMRRALQGGRAVQLARDEAGAREGEWLDRLGLASAVAAPLEGGGRVLGALQLGFREPGRRLSGEELGFCEAVARQLGLAIARAELHEAEREARLSSEAHYEAARRAVRVRDDFLSIAGHELKTPLASIQIEAQTLARLAGDALPPERVAHKAERLVRNVGRLRALVLQLLDVSRASAGRLSLTPEPIDLCQLTAAVLEQARPDLERAGCDARLDAPSPVQGHWDRLRIEAVASNLLSNALKFGRGHPVDVSVRREGEMAVLQVTDQGMGVPPEEQERIFERFEQAVSPREFGGLGLGLWVVRQIVDAHGGSIRVESRPGLGATFRVELPLD